MWLQGVNNIFRGIVIAVALFLFTSCIFAAGSYPFAEYYIVDMQKDSLVNRIELFKQKNPEFRVFQPSKKGGLYEPGGFYYSVLGEPNRHTDARSDSSLFYSCYFYFSDIGAFIHCIMNVSRKGEEHPAILGLSGVTYSPNFGEWLTINGRDISKEENEMIKKKFETEILNELGKWKRDRWWYHW